MDHGERIATVEADVDSIGEQLVEIRAEQIRLREGQDKLRDHMDRGLTEMRDHMDRGFAEMRAELNRTTRWLISLAITYGAAIVGLMAKMAGLF